MRRFYFVMISSVTQLLHVQHSKRFGLAANGLLLMAAIPGEQRVVLVIGAPRPKNPSNPCLELVVRTGDRCTGSPGLTGDRVADADLRRRRLLGLVKNRSCCMPVAIWQTGLTSGDTILAWTTVGTAAPE